MLLVNFISVCLFFGTGCVQDPGQIEDKTSYFSMHSQKIEYRDSLFIAYTLKEWSNFNWQTFTDYSQLYRITNNEVDYSVERIFYSPDMKRMIAWVSERLFNAASIENYSNNSKNNRICPTGGDTIIQMSAVIAFKDSINQSWKIYPLDYQNVECAPTKQIALKIVEEYYFDKMKTHSEYVNKNFLDKNYGGKVREDLEKNMKDMGYNDDASPLVLKEFGYNLQDKDFWEKSLIWQKGARITGLYNFQTKGNVTPEEKDVELILPKINYPDSILKLYK